jgi:hypothetical protein
MISITEAISDLLFVRDTVVVPGLGAFVKKTTSAKVNPVANFFTMPNCDIVFDANLREDNDLIVNYISDKDRISKSEAKTHLVLFVSDCFNKMKQGKKVVLDHIGTMRFDYDNNLVFEQDKSVNYNADAFGLSDFYPEPVVCSKSKDEIKAEIEQQNKEKNTLVTVDEKAVHQEDEKPHRYGWLWVLLGLLVAAGVLYGLHGFGKIRFPWEETQRGPMSAPGTYKLPFYEKKWEWKEPVREANIRIVAGIYGHEEDAARLVNSLHAKGYNAAFYELRGDKWYVSFGRYTTDEEAMTALREIRANTEYKVWILKP